MLKSTGLCIHPSYFISDTTQWFITVRTKTNPELWHANYREQIFRQRFLKTNRRRRSQRSIYQSFITRFGPRVIKETTEPYYCAYFHCVLFNQDKTNKQVEKNITERAALPVMRYNYFLRGWFVRIPGNNMRQFVWVSGERVFTQNVRDICKLRSRWQNYSEQMDSQTNGFETLL